MTKVQVNLSEKADYNLKILMLKYKKTNKADTIKFMLENLDEIVSTLK